MEQIESVACKGCGQMIKFISFNGKFHPINIKPKKVFIQKYPEATGIENLIFEFKDGFESHLSNCSEAWKFRKDRTK